MTTQTNHYFLLNYNPWPFLISMSSFNLMTSFLFFMKFNNFLIFFFSIISVSMLSFFWWISYSSEFNMEGKNSLDLEKGLKTGMILFISSEIFFFFSFFWAYFHFFFSPSMELGLTWIPMNVEFFDFLSIPLVNTLVLMGSGLTVTLSHYYLIVGKKKMFLIWLFTTILMGMFFSFLQMKEYQNSFFSISDANFGSSFFILTGFHGIHVIIGTMFLLTSLLRSLTLNSSLSSFLSFDLSSWYWHFVDVIWIFLYYFIYYMSD